MKRIVTLAGFVLIVVLAAGVRAQGSAGGGAGTGTGQSGFGTDETALTDQEFLSMYRGLGGPAPWGADIVDIVRLAGEDAYAFGPSDALSAADQDLLACPLLTVYKLSPQGYLDWWGDRTSCAGDNITIHSGGTGHYFIFNFSTADDAASAPRVLVPCFGPFATAAGSPQNEAMQQQTQVCYFLGGNTGTGSTASGQGTGAGTGSGGQGGDA